ncbi:MAG: hypothetical protein NZ528_09845 [Caldilineales bacterium]|nr:hypothetical protein [Caldilineales bacterium]
MSSAADRPRPLAPGRPGWDALLLALLLVARLRINTLAEATLFQHFENVTAHSWLGRLLSDQAEAAFGPWFGDPIALLLTATSLAALLIYLLVDLAAADRKDGRRAYRTKLALVWLIVALTVLAPTVKLVLLRHENLPHSYSHDGGVIQTEAAIDFFLAGRNPYVEDYRNTPMAEWGFPEFRTALDHYPYLPWTFVFSAPFRLASDALWGWYDQRFVYLLLFVAGLVLALRLAPADRPRLRLGLLMALGLNPIMALDLIFGQNDLFVWAWIVLALALLPRPPRWPADRRSPVTDRRPLLAALAFGLACASKPTAWFMAPFFALLLVADRVSSLRDLPAALPSLLRRGWPALAAFALLVLPYLLWNADAFVDDVWRWAAGTTETHYQIWGWGASNFVLAFGGLTSRFDYWPFWIPELLVSLPLLIWLVWRQARHNHPAAACWHHALLLFAFLYVSRFLNENYLGYILAFLALGYAAWPAMAAPAPAEAEGAAP